MAEVKPASRALLKLTVLAGLVVGGAMAAALTPAGDFLSREGIGQGMEWLRGSSAAPLIYIAVYAAATALAIPGSILTIAGGVMFGVLWGTVYTTIGANLGANAAFGIARYLGREGVERLAGSRLDGLDRATKNHGFRGLLTLRLIPAVPFNALNFGSGLTSIRWSTYAVATLIGIFPGTLVYTTFADALFVGSQEASRDALVRVLIAGALLVLLSFLPALVKRLKARRAGAALLALCLGGVPFGAAYAEGLAAQKLPSHQPFSDLLARVVRQPDVDYAQLLQDRSGLDAYLATLASVSPEAVTEAPQDARLAFWINAYNACMLRLVIDNYPIQRDGHLLRRLVNTVAGRPQNSVWQIPDVFTRRHCRVAGVERSQDDIEHDFIRPMGDPRIHFAVNCAAKSCPELWPDAYSAETLDEQLDRAVKHLVANSAHFRVEGGSTVRLNKVLDWYQDDFGGIDGLRAFLSEFASDAAASVLRESRTRIEFFEYDWTLNDIGR